jgi:uncharacterized membrane protein YvlD (DUF360 family)
VTGRDVRDAVIGVLPTAVALLLASWVLSGLHLTPWAAVVAAAAVSIADALVRPLLRLIAGRVGAGIAMLLGLAVQLVVLQAALAVAPGAQWDTIGTAAATLVLVAVFGAVGRWLLGAADREYLVADLIRRAERRRRRSGPAGGAAGPGRAPGLVVVQVDGLPYQVLMQGILSGNLPTLSRWVRSGTHTPAEWWARVPSTTPASQAGLLHGSTDGIPAFRWYEKGSDGPGRLVVANRPADAALIEQRLSDGRGLLADDGVSVSNLFSGDAAVNLMVMSRAGRFGGLGPGGDYVRFFASPFIFVRALLLTAAEAVKELHQGRRQRVRGIEPRIRRHGSYVLLRALTNALLRDLNVALVAEHMIRGASVVYVDFVDYDEIAHHAGVLRPESLDAVAGLDGVLATLERVAATSSRHYRFVVLSDHGQSQGATFRQLSGRTLEESVTALVGRPGEAVAETGDVESWGPVNALVSEVAGASSPTSRWAQRRSDGAHGSGVLVGPQRGQPTTGNGADESELVVAGSGNLGLVWFPHLPGRVTLAELGERFPALVPGLLAEPGVAFVVADSGRGPVAVGPRGTRVLADPDAEGEDPLTPFGPRAAADLARVAAMPGAPDLLVHSTVDALTDEVHAFEELVGCHGGLGGWQNRAVLLHPADWPVDDDLLDRSVPGEALLYGAESVHRQLVRWLERSGARAVPAQLSDRAEDDCPAGGPGAPGDARAAAVDPGGLHT